jgi:PAS domain S-box-containing protein
MVKRIRRFLYRATKLRILYASIVVIILILLLALTVNNAREKEMAGMFSRQQLASVQNAAIRMTEIFVNVGKNIALFSDFDSHGRILPRELDPNSEILYAGGDTAVQAILLFDRNGIIRHALPRGVLPAVNLSAYFGALKQKPTEHSWLVFSEALAREYPPQKTGWYLIWGYPVWRNQEEFSGAWMVSYSLASLVDHCERQIRDNELGELWLVDQEGTIVLHPDSYYIGKNIRDLLKNNDGSSIQFPESVGRHVDILLHQKTEKQRSIIAYYPVQTVDQRWFILAVAPYTPVVAPVRTTFIYTMFSAMILILVTVVAGISFAFREGKRIRRREEYLRLKESEAWQEKLLREKKIIDGIIEGSPIPSFVVNRDHKVILWNRACVELTGCPAEEILGTDHHYKPFYSVKRPLVVDLIMDSDIDALNKFYGSKKVRKSEKVPGAYEAYDHFESLGGRSRYMYFLAAPIYDEDGGIIAAMETLQDVSREEELTRSLREYTETLQNELAENIELRREIEGFYNYMRSIVNSLPDKIYEVDNEGVVNFVSMGIKKAQSEFKGRHFLEFVAPENESLVMTKWEEAKNGNYRPYEIEVTRRNGRKAILLVTTSPVVGTDHFILVQRDITELKNLEKKLYDSQKLAALGQLSAGIAHEIRNPLSSIKMSLQILEKRMTPEGNDLKRFKIAQKEVEHLEELVNNVLVYAKPVAPRIAQADLIKILEQAIALAEQGIQAKSVDMKIDVEDIPQVNVDSAMITDAFLNIIRNAVEAVETNGSIRISARSIGSQPPSVLVIVEDNGSGIADEDMPHLFNPFFTKKKHGTGLGLSQVSKIVEQHQGKIEIISEIGKGTKVCVTLPSSEGYQSQKDD